MIARNMINVNLYTTTNHKLPPLKIWAWRHSGTRVNVHAVGHDTALLLSSTGRYTVPKWLKRALTPATADLVRRAARLTANLAETLSGPANIDLVRRTARCYRLTASVDLFMDVCTGAELRLPMTTELAAAAQLTYGGAPWRALTVSMTHGEVNRVEAVTDDNEFIELMYIDGDTGELTLADDARFTKLAVDAAVAAVNELVDTVDKAMNGGGES